MHAADVEQTCYSYLIHSNIKTILQLDSLDCAAFFIAAIIHDFKHPGYTNMYLINTKDDIALRYNGKQLIT